MRRPAYTYRNASLICFLDGASDEFPSCLPASSVPFPLVTLGSNVLQDDIGFGNAAATAAFISVVKLFFLRYDEGFIETPEQSLMTRIILFG